MCIYKGCIFRMLIKCNNFHLKSIREAPGWLSQLGVWLLILLQVMISGSWDRAPCWTLCSVGSLLEILSLPHLFLLLAYSLFQKKRRRRRRRKKKNFPVQIFPEASHVVTSDLSHFLNTRVVMLWNQYKLFIYHYLPAETISSEHPSPDLPTVPPWQCSFSSFSL